MATPLHQQCRRGGGALILVVLIALAIILYLAFGTGGTGTSYSQQLSQSRQNAKQTVVDINTGQLSILIAQYRQENGKLPKSPADFDNPSYFKDQWGNPLAFSFADSRGRTEVTYISKGPDGQANTEDDIRKSELLPF